MKYPFLLFCFLILFTACTGDGKNASTNAGNLESTAAYVASRDQDTAQYKPLYLHQIPAAEDLNAVRTSLGGHGRAFLPDMTRTEAQVLTRNVWCFEFYNDNQASVPQKVAGTGQWFQFANDGTFKGGHWNRQTYAGVWYLDYQEKFPKLTLDANVDAMDAIWQVQAISGDQESMAWVRPSNSGFGPQRRPISAKLIMLTTLPTKEQFANTLKLAQ
ncbi:hypothetical protein QWY85_18130 [Neolewinella lacunae]|uniref:Uncharacterized protein n=1 Tax=Neolewinella lacunae TaxID=1517758 RepID=A0A923PQ33_9BACT|nr:hypothetical protein [Neolewinella lacunae]MBC6995716.1 hypothetical protein [Neolewinella lacunae]MDN3636591.1 hypothetical protein [Neolewinella lacunae]